MSCIQQNTSKCAINVRMLKNKHWVRIFTILEVSFGFYSDDLSLSLKTHFFVWVNHTSIVRIKYGSSLRFRKMRNLLRFELFYGTVGLGVIKSESQLVSKSSIQRVNWERWFLIDFFILKREETVLPEERIVNFLSRVTKFSSTSAYLWFKFKSLMSNNLLIKYKTLDLILLAFCLSDSQYKHIGFNLGDSYFRHLNEFCKFGLRDVVVSSICNWLTPRNLVKRK